MMAAVVAVLVIGAVVFFGSDRLVVALEAVDLVMVGLCYHELFGETVDLESVVISIELSPP